MTSPLPRATPLVNVLHFPLLNAHIPGAKSPSWRAVEFAIQRALKPYCHSRPIRTWTALWRIARNSLPPRTARWVDLCDGIVLDDLIKNSFLVGSNKRSPFTCWNPRWLKKSQSDKAKGKAFIIREHLYTGKVMLLQGTHWTQVDRDIWGSCFPGTRIFESLSPSKEERGVFSRRGSLGPI